jgi:hypothetical protein
MITREQSTILPTGVEEQVGFELARILQGLIDAGLTADQPIRAVKPR